MYINEKVMLISIKHTVADHTCAVRAYDQCNKDAKTKDELYGIVDRRGPALPIAVVVAISQHALAHHDHHHPIKNESPPLHCTFKQLKRIFTNNMCSLPFLEVHVQGICTCCDASLQQFPAYGRRRLSLILRLFLYIITPTLNTGRCICMCSGTTFTICN